MEIIKFPGVEKLNKKAERKVSVERLDKINEALTLGPITVSCRNCAKPMSLTVSGLIFRTMEIYCSHCGTHHRITNPAFSDSVAIQRKKAKDI
jgi:hypothetical protein